MTYCSGCNQEVSEQYCVEPRAPCPFCGALGRKFDAQFSASLSFQEDFSSLQERPAPGGFATLDNAGLIKLNLEGRPPQNEEDSPAVSARLQRRLNAAGGNWSKPDRGVGDVDIELTDIGNKDVKLNIQVIRASASEALWHSLATKGAVVHNYSVISAADELAAAIERKQLKYPLGQRSKLTPVLDAGRTPSHTFQPVLDAFSKAHGATCRDAGFASVWLVGASDDMVVRLDE